MDSNVVFPDLPTFTGDTSPAGLLSVAITVVLPILAALFMRGSWTAMQKGLVLLGFAAVKAFLEAWLATVVAGAGFHLVLVLYVVGVQFVLAVVSYVGLWRGTPVQRSAMAGGPVRERRLPPSS